MCGGIDNCEMRRDKHGISNPEIPGIGLHSHEITSLTAGMAKGSGNPIWKTIRRKLAESSGVTVWIKAASQSSAVFCQE